METKPRRTALAATTLALVGLLSTDASMAGPSPQSRVTRDAPSVVLTPGQARSGSRGIHADSYWSPTSEDVRAVEEGLRRRSPADGKPLPPGLMGYYRQYVGIVVGGRRCVYVNGFSAGVAGEFAKDWRRRPIFVDDGGDAFFHVTYDPKERRFHDFSFNGYA